MSLSALGRDFTMNAWIRVSTVIVLGVGLCAAVYYFLPKSDRQSIIRPNTENAQNGADDLAELRQRVEVLEAQVARLAGQMAAGQPHEIVDRRDKPPQEADSSTPHAKQRPRELRDDQGRAHARQRWHEHMADVELNFQQQARDPQWSSSTALVLRDALNDDEGLRLASTSNIDCRSQTCRVEIADDGSGRVLQRLPELTHRLSEKLPTVQVDQFENGNRQQTVVMYLSRDSTQAVSAQGIR